MFVQVAIPSVVRACVCVLSTSLDIHLDILAENFTRTTLEGENSTATIKCRAFRLESALNSPLPRQILTWLRTNQCFEIPSLLLFRLLLFVSKELFARSPLRVRSDSAPSEQRTRCNHLTHFSLLPPLQQQQSSTTYIPSTTV